MKNNITVDDLVRREVVCCVSGLVTDLRVLLDSVPVQTLHSVSVDYDDLQSLFGKEDWETPITYHIKNSMCRGEVIDALDMCCVPAIPGEDPRRELNDLELEDLLLQTLAKEATGYQDFASENNIDPEWVEVYEHWVVSDWLASKLKEHDEVVADVGNLTVWGRCTTGQMISMDGVIGKIYNELIGETA